MPSYLDILIKTISPTPCHSELDFLQRQLADENFAWEQVLLLANHHRLTPLWYLQLKQHDLLQFAPTELQDYLQALYEMNAERNTAFLNALIDLSQSFGQQDIAVMPLKGGAALVDNLYDGVGARIMGDLDILVPADALKLVPETLASLNYSWDLHEEKDWLRVPVKARYHFPRAFLDNSLVVAEIHHRVMFHFANGAFNEEDIWQHATYCPIKKQQSNHQQIALARIETRLLHTCLHAMKDALAYPATPPALQAHIEAAWLINRSHTDIDWQTIMENAKQGGELNSLHTFLHLHNSYLHNSQPDNKKNKQLPEYKLSLSSKWQLLLLNSPWQNANSKTRAALAKLLNILRYPTWLWHTNVHGEDTAYNKLKHLCRRLLKKATWQKITTHLQSKNK